MLDITTTLAHVKNSLRIKHNQLDSEITSNINSAVLDMGRVGILKTDDDLALTCIEFYVKGIQNFDGKGQLYSELYEKNRDAMSLSGTYNTIEEAEV